MDKDANAKKSTQVDEQMMLMEERLSLLNDAVMKLDTQLQKVCRELEPPQPETQSSGPELVSLAWNLYENNCEIEKNTERILSIINRLEV